MEGLWRARGEFWLATRQWEGGDLRTSGGRSGADARGGGSWGRREELRWAEEKVAGGAKRSKVSSVESG